MAGRLPGSHRTNGHNFVTRLREACAPSRCHSTGQLLGLSEVVASKVGSAATSPLAPWQLELEDLSKLNFSSPTTNCNEAPLPSLLHTFRHQSNNRHLPALEQQKDQILPQKEFDNLSIAGFNNRKPGLESQCAMLETCFQAAANGPAKIDKRDAVRRRPRVHSACSLRNHGRRDDGLTEGVWSTAALHSVHLASFNSNNSNVSNTSNSNTNNSSSNSNTSNNTKSSEKVCHMGGQAASTASTTNDSASVGKSNISSNSSVATNDMDSFISYSGSYSGGYNSSHSISSSNNNNSSSNSSLLMRPAFSEPIEKASCCERHQQGSKERSFSVSDFAKYRRVQLAPLPKRVAKPQAPVEKAPQEATRYIDDVTDCPQELFNRMMLLGKEARARGQHVRGRPQSAQHSPRLALASSDDEESPVCRPLSW